MKREDAFKLFGLNNLSVESDLRRIAAQYDIDIGRHNESSSKIEAYYPQFPEKLRAEAASMAAHYAIFYCLENSIRELVVQRLEEARGANWWDVAVPETVRKNAEGNRKKELSTGVTPRSDLLIDYSNFGELGEIIKTNWDIFGDMFRDVRGLERSPECAQHTASPDSALQVSRRGRSYTLAFDAEGLVSANGVVLFR